MDGRPFSAALSEHIIIYEYLIRDAVDAAAMALENHIKLSAKRTNLRLKALSIFPTPPIPSWLTQRSP
jgi:DNA-binding GntR family transcriptional regulator